MWNMLLNEELKMEICVFTIILDFNQLNNGSFF